MTLPKRNWGDIPILHGGRFSSLRQARNNGRTKKYRASCYKTYDTQLMHGVFSVFGGYSKFLHTNRCIRRFSGDLVSLLNYNLDQIRWINFPDPDPYY